MVSAAARNVVTRDRVPVGVDAVIWLRVVDPVKAVLNIGNYRHARVRETRHGVADRSRTSGPCRRRRPATRVGPDTGCIHCKPHAPTTAGPGRRLPGSPPGITAARRTFAVGLLNVRSRRTIARGLVRREWSG
jgi:hypothetical protein